MFLQVVNLKKLAAGTAGVNLITILNRLLVNVDQVVEECRAYKIMAIADMYMCVAGDTIAASSQLPGENHVRQLCKAALKILELLRVNDYSVDGTPLTVKVGINCGPVASGVIGRKTLNYHVFGDAVNVASRMCSTSLDGCIQLSSEAAQYLYQHGGRHKVLVERGEILVKGKGLMRTYWLPPEAWSSDTPMRRSMTPFAQPVRSAMAAPARKRRLHRRISERGSITQLERFLKESAQAQAVSLSPITMAFIADDPNDDKGSNIQTAEILASSAEMVE